MTHTMKLAEITNSLSIGTRAAKKEAFRPVRSRNVSFTDESDTNEHGQYLRGAAVLRQQDRIIYDALDENAGTDITWIEIEKSTGAFLLPAADIKILQGVHHTNILRFLDSWETGKHVIMATERMAVNAGVNVRELLRKTGLPRLRVLQSWTKQALNALQYLHTRRPRIAHRDVNCSTMYVDGRTLKLGTLCNAGILHDGTVSGIVGQVESRAPEMYMGPYTESVDVYAFGLALLHMATRHLPYEECHGDEQAIRAKAASHGPEGYSRLWSKDAADFIRDCIHPQPEMRPRASVLLTHPFLTSDCNEAPVLRVCKVNPEGSVDLRLSKLTQGSPTPSGMRSPGGSTLQSIDFTLDPGENPADVAKQLVKENLIDATEENAVCATLSRVPVAIQNAMEGTMMADITQAYVDALGSSDANVADMLHELSVRQAQERAQLARTHVQQLKDLIKSAKSPGGSGNLVVPGQTGQNSVPPSPYIRGGHS